MKIKMHMDCQEELTEKVIEHILDKVSNHYDDEVWEFELKISNVKNITKEVGVDEEGARAFFGVEITEEEDGN